MKESEICLEAIREYLIKPLDDGFEKESVDLAYYGEPSKSSGRILSEK